MDGYVKLYRKLSEWEWYRNSNTKNLFLHCLLRANFKETKWQGKVIPQGSFVTSYGNLSSELGLSVREIRTALKNLKSTSELTSKTTNKYTLIKVENWAYYQSDNSQGDKQDDKQVDIQTTSKRQANDKQTTTDEESKELKNDKNIKKEDLKDIAPFVATPVANKTPKIKFGEYKQVLLTQDQFDKLNVDFPNVSELIKFLDEYIQMKGYKAKDHNLAIRKWVVDAVKERELKNGNNHVETVQEEIERRTKAVMKARGEVVN